MANSSYQVPVIQTSYAKILVQIFTDYGLDLHKLLEDSGLPPDLIESESDFVPSESIKRLIYLISSQLGVSRFTDVLGLAFRRRIIPYVLHQFTEFETIGDSLKHINTIFSYDSPGSSVDFVVEHGQSWFCRTSPDEPSSMFQWGEVFAITYIIELITILSHSPWQPTKIRLQGHDSDLKRYRQCVHRSSKQRELWFTYGISSMLWYANNHKTIIELVEQNVGWANVPEIMVMESIQKGDLVALPVAHEHGGWITPVGCLVPRSHINGPVLTSLIEKLEGYSLQYNQWQAN